MSLIDTHHHKFRAAGIVFTAVEVIMHAYILMFLLSNGRSGAFRWSAAGFTFLEMALNLYYLFMFVILPKRKEAEENVGGMAIGEG